MSDWSMFNNRLALVNAIWLIIWHWLMCNGNFITGPYWNGLFQLSWGIMYFSIQDFVSHGIAPIHPTNPPPPNPFRSPMVRRDSWLLFGKVDTISRMNEIDTTHFTWGMLIIFCQRSHKHDWIFRVKGILLCSFHNMTFSFIRFFFFSAL